MNSQDSSVERLTKALDRLTLAIEGKRRGGTEEWEVISEANEDQSAGSATVEDPFRNIPFGDYNSFAAVFLVVLIASLAGAQCCEVVSTPQSIEQRGPGSGVWASLVLQGRLVKPREPSH